VPLQDRRRRLAARLGVQDDQLRIWEGVGRVLDSLDNVSVILVCPASPRGPPGCPGSPAAHDKTWKCRAVRVQLKTQRRAGAGPNLRPTSEIPLDRNDCLHADEISRAAVYGAKPHLKKLARNYFQ